MPLVFAAIVCAAVASNFVLLAAIGAGRLNKGWGRRGLLAVEMTFIAVVVVAGVGAGLAVADSMGWQVARRDIRVGLVGAVAFGLGAGLGGILTYLEYSAVGRRGTFDEDIHRSIWFGRGGLRRWDGGRT
jgi:hypothetical protein